MAHIEVATGRPPAQPLDRPANQKINSPTRGVQFDRARRLIDVQQHQRADSVRTLDDRPWLDTIRAAKRRVRESNKASSVVDRFKDAFQWNRNTIIGRNDFNSCSESGLCFPD